MNSPRISVIMSVYNGLPYLNLAVESILNQSFGDFEFIIIDDGSNDGSFDTISQYAALDNRIILIRNPANMGYTRSLNIGLERAKGDFIARQDADDISQQMRFEKQVDFLGRNPQVGLLGTFSEFIDENGNLLSGNYPLITQNAQIQTRLYEMNCIRHGSVMIRRSSLEKVGMYYDVELEPSEDYDLWLRIGEVAEIDNYPEALYIYREHPASESSKRRFRQMHNKAISLERAIVRRFGQNPPKKQLGMVASDYFRASIIGITSNHQDEGIICLQKAFELQHDFFNSREPSTTLVDRYIPKNNPQAAIEYIDRLFDELIKEHPNLANLKKRLLGKYHVEAAFSKLHEKDLEKVEHHIRQGVRNDPFWLGNRGVRSIIMKLILRRIGIPVRLNGNTA